MHRAMEPNIFCNYCINPTKGVELSSRYRYEHKPANSTADEGPLKPVLKTIRQNWRTQVMFQATPDIMLKSRIELVWYQAGAAANAEKGFAAFTEVFYAPKILSPPICGSTFSKRMVIMPASMLSEQDVQYYFSIPQFSGKGFGIILIVSRMYPLYCSVSVPERLIVWCGCVWHSFYFRIKRLSVVDLMKCSPGRRQNSDSSLC